MENTSVPFTFRDKLFELSQFLFDYESWADRYPGVTRRGMARHAMLNFKHDMELRGMCFEPPFAEDALQCQLTTI